MQGKGNVKRANLSCHVTVYIILYSWSIRLWHARP